MVLPNRVRRKASCSISVNWLSSDELISSRTVVFSCWTLSEIRSMAMVYDSRLKSSKMTTIRV